MRDTLPAKPSAVECGVMNLDDSDGNGTHWVAWLCSKAFSVYFDSYGVDMPDAMMKYLRQHRGKLLASDGAIQSADTVTCGYYCVDFIRSCHDKSLPDIVDWLNNYDPFGYYVKTDNERIVVERTTTND